MKYTRKIKDSIFKKGEVNTGKVTKKLIKTKCIYLCTKGGKKYTTKTKCVSLDVSTVKIFRFEVSQNVKIRIL